MPLMHVEEAVELIQMEYQEMPGLTLTFWQAQRLWNLSDDWCERALTILTGSGFLVRTFDGRYVRRDRASAARRRLESPVRIMHEPSVERPTAEEGT